MNRETIFSPCRKYRYTLWREWHMPAGLPLGMERDEKCNQTPLRGSGEYLQVIGLNPSTADETNDDPTIRRCIDFARQWGFGALCMTNAFAWRATDPEAMKRQRFPIAEPLLGQQMTNDYWLSMIAKESSIIIAAWGKHGTYLGRDDEILRFIPNVQCLALNEDGTPRHPLYLPRSLRPQPYHKRTTNTTSKNYS